MRSLSAQLQRANADTALHRSLMRAMTDTIEHRRFEELRRRAQPQLDSLRHCFHGRL